MLDLNYRLRPNFYVRELACKCGCGYGRELEDYDDEALDLLQGIRDDVGHELGVNSGLRCKRHNTEEGGVDDSTHCRAAGFDIKARDTFTRRRIVDAAVRRGARGIGIAKTFVHVDSDQSGRLPRPGIWSY